MDPAHLELLCEEFALGTPISAEENHHGVLNRNFEITTANGRYFVKGVRAKSRERVPYIAAVETFMREGGIPAVCMVRTKTGALYVEYGQELYTVYPLLENVMSDELTPYKELGSLLARIHVRGSSARPSLLETSVLSEKEPGHAKNMLLSFRERAAAGTTAIDAQFLAYIDKKLELFDSLPSGEFVPDTLVHGDYHARNILFNAAKEIVGVCDWEKAELAPRAYEFARSLQYICFESRLAPYQYDRVLAIERGREFLAGYREVFPLMDEELRRGFDLRMRKLVITFWIEDAYYTHSDERSNQFVENETNLLEEFSNPKVIEALC